MNKVKTTFLITLLSSISVFAVIKQATYEVPTSQSELQASSIFNLSDVSISRNKNNVTTLKYLVPEELTGEKNEIEFSGVFNGGEGKLNSEYGNLKCLTTVTKLSM